ncbi:hypothetical protein RhiirA4_473549 [Rhizophagus irregularis]|uniref:Uncharacterized protein n=1 Tax=Rhizophagus irregularis TaxID=588596 RepID=A0A2I1H6Y1_9GLOM|nr:hypothetical protein RhiirA4_473549 [Rhizophagus irregularis]
MSSSEVDLLRKKNRTLGIILGVSNDKAVRDINFPELEPCSKCKNDLTFSLKAFTTLSCDMIKDPSDDNFNIRQGSQYKKPDQEMVVGGNWKGSSNSTRCQQQFESSKNDNAQKNHLLNHSKKSSVENVSKLQPKAPGNFTELCNRAWGSENDEVSKQLPNDLSKNAIENSEEDL